MASALIVIFLNEPTGDLSVGFHNLPETGKFHQAGENRFRPDRFVLNVQVQLGPALSQGFMGNGYEKFFELAFLIDFNRLFFKPGLRISLFQPIVISMLEIFDKQSVKGFIIRIMLFDPLPIRLRQPVDSIKTPDKKGKKVILKAVYPIEGTIDNWLEFRKFRSGFFYYLLYKQQYIVNRVLFDFRILG